MIGRSALIIVVLRVLSFSAAAGAQQTTEGPPLAPATVEHFLPVHTEAMRPGPFEPQRHPTGVSRPFFLIGCDTASLTWLERNHDRLIEMGAFGLVVEAPDVAAYRQLEEIAEGLVIRPVSADLIAEHLRIEHYPVLITSEGIFP